MTGVLLYFRQKKPTAEAIGELAMGKLEYSIITTSVRIRERRQV